ncbi:hypothetical protein ACIQVO_38365 [Streptomyces sp. NPDC101062]
MRSYPNLLSPEGMLTTAEIRYARAFGLPVRFTHPQADPDPQEQR